MLGMLGKGIRRRKIEGNEKKKRSKGEELRVTKKKKRWKGNVGMEEETAE